MDIILKDDNIIHMVYFEFSTHLRGIPLTRFRHFDQKIFRNPYKILVEIIFVDLMKRKIQNKICYQVDSVLFTQF